MTKIKGNLQLERLYPDEFPNQCSCLKNTCDCGYRFKADELECPDCGAKRKRCRNRHMTNEDVCRNHAVGRPYHLYTKLAANISDTALEEFIEKDNGRDLSQEYALAKIALSGILEDSQLSSKELLENLNSFFNIAQKKKRIEEGDTLNIQWNDELVNSLRKRWRLVIKAIGNVLVEELTPLQDRIGPDFDINFFIRGIMNKVREQTRLLGNSVTVSDKDGRDAL